MQTGNAAPGGTNRAQDSFQRGLTALHNFEYEEANDAFRDAQTADRNFALAYWGEAMTYHQALWRRENVAAAREVLARLGATSLDRAKKAAGPREQGLLGAVEILFGDGDPAARRQRYAAAMEQLSGRFPDDPDVNSLYALALLGTASRGLIGFSDAHDQHDAGLAGSAVQTRVASILTRVLSTHPRHPGALHYLLHAYDDPEHARLALDAARTYATVAAGSSHALHMPSHVFLQLGMWHEAASSDRAAFDASTDWVRRRNLEPALRNYHALAWLQYELLQLGRYREAQATIGDIEPVVQATGALTRGGPLLSDLSSMRARFVVEARRWDVLSHERNFGNADELFAVGMSAAQAKNLDLTQMAEQALAQRAQSEQEGDLRPVIAIMEREVAGVIAAARGRTDEALGILRAAAQSELALPAPLGLPKPLKPATELLAETLLQAGQPREAVEYFQQTLKRHANRSPSILGLARAASAMGDGNAATQRYRELLTNYNGADADLAEVAEARAALENRRAADADPRTSIGRSVASGVAVIVLLGILVLRARRIRSVQKPQRTQGTQRKRK